MIRDLKLSTEDRIECPTEVCIIGAGTAGIFLAARLRRKGMRVVLLEAGDRVACRPSAAGQRCVQRGLGYRGADLGRSFGLGGTSVLWGGQMIPLTAADMAARPAVGIEAWPIGYADLAAHVAAVKQTLGLGSGGDGDELDLLSRRFPALARFDADFQLRLSQWLPFATRNFAQAFAAPLRTDPDLEVWLNASVVRLGRSADGAGRIVVVEALSPTGRTLVVRPEVLVVCAGALESTRLMLAFDDSAGGLLTRAGAPLGHYFADHLSVPCGRFECYDRPRFNLATAPIFAKGVMRTPRLEVSSAAQQRLGVTSAFAHFAFITHGDTGFDVVRSLLRKRQGEQPGLGRSPVRLGVLVGDLSAMALWRGVYRRLWVPPRADLLLYVDCEQVPNRASCISLSDERDDVGRKRLQIDWQITGDDIRVIREVAQRVTHAWKGSPLHELANLRLTLPEKWDDLTSLYDVYHPTGTLRMGNNRTRSVVDSELRVWGLENCYVSSTAVFPSAGSANPGLTHLALTVRLADRIAKSRV